jgi:subtilisin family serine protease
MKWRIFRQLIVILLLLPSSAQAGSIVPSVTKCSVEGTELDSGGYHFVCSKNSKKVLAWMPAKRNIFGGSDLTGTKNSAENRVTISKPTIIVQAKPKAIPTLVPNTTIPWPNPIGNIDAYPGIERTQHANDLFGLKDLHKQGITGAGYSVAFIDSPMIPSHPAFASTSAICVTDINPEADQVTNCPTSVSGFSHGQGVAGTIGGIFGVAPGVKLISISSNARPGSVNQGLNWVSENYKKYNIVAVSVSVGAPPMNRTTEDLVCGVFTPKGFQDILVKLSNLDIAVLFSTANQSTVNWVREPNCMPGVIAVASVRSDIPQTIALYSSISPDVDILAPADFFSAGSNNDEVMFGGTSQATPFAAAIFALGKQARPEANIAQIFYFMKLTGAPVDDVFAKGIPIVRPVEMVKAIKAANALPLISLVKQIQVKSAS